MKYKVTNVVRDVEVKTGTAGTRLDALREMGVFIFQCTPPNKRVALAKNAHGAFDVYLRVSKKKKTDIFLLAYRCEIIEE